MHIDGGMHSIKQARIPGLDLNQCLSIPPRSLLYSISPIAKGSYLVESLSGYLNRVAIKHAVSVSDLIEMDVFPIEVAADEDKRVRRRLFHASCYLMDGSESYSRPWVDALESATMQQGLEAMTLLPYSGLCEGSWLRCKRAWCPQCLEAWREAGSQIYEPLLWSSKFAYRCPEHRAMLESKCCYCDRSWPPLGGWSHPGHCAWCFQWLGSSNLLPIATTCPNMNCGAPDKLQL
jgi:TniQ